MKNIIEKIGIANIVVISLAIITMVINVYKGEFSGMKVLSIALSVVILLLVVYKAYNDYKGGRNGRE